MWGALSDEKSFLVSSSIASAAFLSSESNGTHVMFHCIYFLRLSELEGQVPVFISSRNRVAQLYPLAS
jgi:hypothetical protein